MPTRSRRLRTPVFAEGCSEDIVKAIVQDRYGPPDVLELREIDKPGLGRDGDVLLYVSAAGVDPASGI